MLISALNSFRIFLLVSAVIMSEGGEGAEAVEGERFQPPPLPAPPANAVSTLNQEEVAAFIVELRGVLEGAWADAHSRPRAQNARAPSCMHQVCSIDRVWSLHVGRFLTHRIIYFYCCSLAEDLSSDPQAQRFCTDATLERFSRAVNYDQQKVRAFFISSSKL